MAMTSWSEADHWVGICLWGLVLVTVVPLAGLSLAGVLEGGPSDAVNALLLLAVIPATLAVVHHRRCILNNREDGDGDV